MYGPSAAQMANWLSATRSDNGVVPVQRRRDDGGNRGGGAVDYEDVRTQRDGYRLLLAAIFAVPSGAAIEADDDGRRAAAVVD